MEQNKPSPYSGNEPYIFVSYSHQNEATAMDVIQKLQASGFRVWYDAGIPPGCNWKNHIAQHVEKCSFFLALLTQEFIGSRHCEVELDYATELNKSILPIFLQDIQLPSGMRMYLNRLQVLHRSEYDEKQFYEKLFSAQGIACCRDLSASQIIPAPLSSSNKNITKTETPLCMFDHPEAPFRLILVVDTSGSMTGTRIAELNQGIQRTAASLSEKYSQKLAIDILQFDTLPRWRTLDDLPLKSNGLTNMGEALKSLRQYGQNITKKCACAVVFVSDGHSSDPYLDTFNQLKQEGWFYRTIKTGIAIGDDGATEMLTHITGSPHAVVSITDIPSLSSLLQRICFGSVMAAEQNAGRKTHIDGRDIIDWLDYENVDEEIKWSFHRNGTLKIIAGAIIPDLFPSNTQPPWAAHRKAIKQVILSDRVRVVGTYAFSNLPNLEKVFIPASVTNIRSFAFASCPKLKNVFFSQKAYFVSNAHQKNTAPEKCTFIWPNAFTGTLWAITKKSKPLIETK